MSYKRKDCNWIRVGDEVKIVDSSWSMVYLQGELYHRGSRELPSGWKVIAVGLVLPTESDNPSDSSPNDTIIWNGLSRITVFIKHNFLEPIGATLITCQECGARMRVDS